MDGPGKCAGRLEIHFEGKWQKVDEEQWVDSYSNVVCQQLKCGNARKSQSTEKFSMGSSQFLRKKITCNAGVKHISECTVKDLSNSQGDREAVGIICAGESSFLSLSVLPFDLLLLSLTVILHFHTVSYIL